MKIGKPNKKSTNQVEKILADALTNYMNPNGSSYDNVFTEDMMRLQPQWFVDTAADSKKALLRLASSGANKPKCPDKLAIRLGQYTSRKSQMYDVGFDLSIRAVRPDWFVKKAVIYKDRLLAIARSGQPRPSRADDNSRKLANALIHYTNQSSNSYDNMFNVTIRKLRPEWFIDTAAENKKRLLELAKSGAPRPNKKKNKLGQLLVNYTSKSCKSYDHALDAEIRLLRPDWWADTSSILKQQLLDRAESGGKRPSGTAKNVFERSLGNALIRFTGRNNRSYDESFHKRLLAVRSDWWTDSSGDRKCRLLEMARNGAKKPAREGGKRGDLYRLAQSLRNYMNEKSDTYDRKFTEEIRRLRPDWFVKPCDLTKQLLLSMALRGEPKPQYRVADRSEHLLGVKLYSYTNPSSQSYDPVFNAEIRRLRPDWFRR